MADADEVPPVDVLVPTFERPGALAVTLAGLAAQTLPGFRVVVSDQSERGRPLEAPAVRAAADVLRTRGHPVEMVRHLPRRGLAEHRHSLLDRVSARYALFLDDDVLLEADAIARLVAAIRRAGCGFVGFGLIGPSYRDEARPDQQRVEPWDGPVRPEVVAPGGPEWDRHHLHSAANVLHAARALGLGPGRELLYRVAWIGGCVMYDAAALREAGGFGFWRDLPPAHAGEDVLAQLRVMARRGGAGLLPSGAYHLELPTTVPDRDVDAPRVLPVAGPA